MHAKMNFQRMKHESNLSKQAHLYSNKKNSFQRLHKTLLHVRIHGLDNLKTDRKEANMTHMLRTMKEMKLWRNMTAKVIRHGTS